MRRISIFALVFALSASAALAEPQGIIYRPGFLGLVDEIELGVSGRGSFVNFSTEEEGEVSKRGGGGSAMLDLGIPFKSVLVRGSAGFAGVFIKGANDGLNEINRYSGLALSLGIDWHIIGDWDLGLSNFILAGPGSTFRFNDRKTVRAVVFAGPRLSYHIPRLTTYLDRWMNMDVFFEQLFDLNVTGSFIAMSSLGVTLRVPVKAGEWRSTDINVDSHDINRDTHTLRFTVARFNFAKASLSSGDRKRLKKFAQALIAHREEWQNLTITGHGDQRGRPERTHYWSEQRAEMVKNSLIKAGIDQMRVKAQGLGYSQLLEGLSAFAAEHRRVEIIVDGVSMGSSLEQKLTTALQPSSPKKAKRSKR
jgi:outer membrane protein OmpA-like peptidoglycan-associated protein